MARYWEVPLPRIPGVPASFLPVWQWTIRVERGPGDGRIDDPDDLGGRTKDGITQNTFDAFNLDLGRPRRDVWTITDAETVEIYFVNYWRRGRCDLLDDRTDNPDRIVAKRLALVHYDSCINHGIRGVSRRTGRAYGAAPMLQEVLGVTPDGYVGKATLAALDERLGVSPGLTPIHAGSWSALIAADLRLADALIARREKYYRGIVASKPKQAKFLRGWLGRLAVLSRILRTL